MSKNRYFKTIDFQLLKHDNKKRLIKDIKFVVIHYTNLQSVLESLKILSNPKTKVSAHYLISNDGTVFNLVHPTHTAWHAGKSKWLNYKNLNKHSIGIELQNRGIEFGYHTFPSKQITSLINLCLILKKKYNINTKNFLGHSDIAPLRKVDPGNKFPWKKLSDKGLGLWLNSKKISLNKKKLNQTNRRYFFFSNLHKIGYRYFSIKNRSSKDKFIIRAFKSHYNPSNQSSEIDRKSQIISDILAKSL